MHAGAETRKCEICYSNLQKKPIESIHERMGIYEG